MPHLLELIKFCFMLRLSHERFLLLLSSWDSIVIINAYSHKEHKTHGAVQLGECTVAAFLIIQPGRGDWKLNGYKLHHQYGHFMMLYVVTKSTVGNILGLKRLIGLIKMNR